MTDYRERFLEAEEKAVDLVTQLDALKKEAMSYHDAASTLKDVHDALLKMLDEQEEIAFNLRNVIKTLLEIRTPEILENLDSLSERTMEQITSSSSDILTKLDSHAVNTTKYLSSSLEENAASFREVIILSRESSDEKFKLLDERLTQQSKDFESQVNQLENTLKRINYFQYAIIGLITVASVMLYLLLL